MGDGQGFILFDELSEFRTTLPLEPSTLPKTDRHDLTFAGIYVLRVQLAHPLGRPHDARGPHRLVGRDEHEFPDTIFDGKIDAVLRADNIVVHRRVRIQLAEPDMLVGRRVEDDLGHGFPEQVLEVAIVGDTGQHFPHTVIRKLFRNPVEIVFAVVHHDDRLRAILDALPHELASDTPPAARDHDPLTLDKALDHVLVEILGIAREQILDLNVPELTRKSTRFDNMPNRRQDLDHIEKATHLFIDAVHLRAARAGNGDEQQIELRLVAGPLLKLFPRENAHRIDVPVMQVTRVINKILNPILAVHKLFPELGPRLARAVNHHGLRLGPPCLVHDVAVHRDQEIDAENERQQFRHEQGNFNLSIKNGKIHDEGRRIDKAFEKKGHLRGPPPARRVVPEDKERREHAQRDHHEHE